MAWAWTNEHTTRVDHFAVASPPRRPLREFAASLPNQAHQLYESAANAGVEPGGIADDLDMPVLGSWFTPLESEFEVFLGVVAPDIVAQHVEAVSAAMADGLDDPERAALPQESRQRQLAEEIRQGVEGFGIGTSSAMVGPVVTVVSPPARGSAITR